VYHKKKWTLQLKQRNERRKRSRRDESAATGSSTGGGVVRTSTVGLGGFLRKTAQTILNTPWQIVHLAETGQRGVYKLWAVIGSDLHAIKLQVPRIFYVNQKTVKEGDGACTCCLTFSLYILFTIIH